MSKMDEAVVQYDKALRQAPELVNRDLENIRNAFRQSNRYAELESLIRNVQLDRSR